MRISARYGGSGAVFPDPHGPSINVIEQGRTFVGVWQSMIGRNLSDIKINYFGLVCFRINVFYADSSIPANKSSVI